MELSCKVCACHCWTFSAAKICCAIVCIARNIGREFISVVLLRTAKCVMYYRPFIIIKNSL